MTKEQCEAQIMAAAWAAAAALGSNEVQRLLEQAISALSDAQWK